MALISISSLSSKKITPTKGSSVEFDGYLSATPVISNVVTRRPIEDGFDLNDAVHNNANMLSVEIIITDTAQNLVDKRSVTNLGNIFGTQFFQTHVQRQLDNLEAISRNKVSISLDTKYRKYKGYLIENISYGETDEQALRINFSLVEARFNVSEQEQDDNGLISKLIGLWS